MVITLVLALYFISSGLIAVLHIDEKLSRIDLKALSSDGKIAFILIYSSLMTGIGASMLAMYWLLKSWHPSLLLAATILACFITFRIIGSFLVGSLSDTQLTYILVELMEFGVVALLLYRANVFCKTQGDF